MARKKAQCHAVKKTPPTFRPFNPKPIHGREQPQKPNQLSQPCLRSGFVIDFDNARLPLIRGEMESRPKGIGFQTNQKVAWIEQRYKLVRDGRKKSLQLFDIPADTYPARSLKRAVKWFKDNW